MSPKVRSGFGDNDMDKLGIHVAPMCLAVLATRHNDQVL